MLQLTIYGREFWDDKHEEFIKTKDVTLSLEHSLVSVSKWEIKYLKPFISDKEKTTEEMFYYIKCMTITQNVDPTIYRRMTKENIEEIKKYIEHPSTATWFTEQPGHNSGSKSKKEQITNELIYYWMTALQIPMECEKWHLNRLMTLIRICNIKNKNPKKQSKREIMRNNSSLNAARRNGNPG